MNAYSDLSTACYVHFACIVIQHSGDELRVGLGERTVAQSVLEDSLDAAILRNVGHLKFVLIKGIWQSCENVTIVGHSKGRGCCGRVKVRTKRNYLGWRCSARRNGAAVDAGMGSAVDVGMRVVLLEY